MGVLIMDEATRFIFNEREKLIIKLERECNALRNAAKDICDYYVSSDMYAQAMQKIENVYNQDEDNVH